MATSLQTTNITEEQVIIAFHSFLQGALAQAHAERLLDTAILTSIEADIQIQGPAICLFLAALRSEGDPPSIDTSLLHLDEANCPPSFRNWFKLWAGCVPQIKGLSGELRHDLARIICDQEPECQPISIHLPILAQNLRAIAIEISQRRTFQERFTQDLDYALQYRREHDALLPTTISAQYFPPPAYDESLSPEPCSDLPTLPHTNNPPSSDVCTSHVSPGTKTPPSSDTPAAHVSHPSQDDDPVLRIIRETLYASLADVIYSTPTLHFVFQSKNSSDGELSRAYFASLCLAILNVSLEFVNPNTRTIKVVNLGNGCPSELRIEDCPVHLQSLVTKLVLIASLTQKFAEEDTQNAIQHAGKGGLASGQPTKIECLRSELEHGLNWETAPHLLEVNERASSQLGSVRTVANVINAHALRVSQIESFREREEALFEVLIPALKRRQGKRTKSRQFLRMLSFSSTDRYK